MKHIIYLIAVLFAGLSAQARTYTLGTYNIRIAKSEDSLLCAWDSRKGAVIQTVITNHTDVCSFQEIYNDQQEQDLRDSLAPAGYDMYTWGRGSATMKTGERLAVAWNDSILEKLDQGFYFHTFNPQQTGIVLDASHARLTVWVKLRDRETNDIFYYFSTHLDVQGKRARREAAWLNNEYVRTLSGKYPAVLAGDFNVDGRDQTVLDINRAYLNDSYYVAQTTPQGPYRTHPGFVSPQTISATGGARMDFILSKCFTIHSYKVSTEDFGRGIVPSDHLFTCVTATPLSLQQCDSIQSVWYVNDQAKTPGTGDQQNPFQTLEEALEAAQPGDTIRCVAGVLQPQTKGSPYYTITKSIFLEGGYNEDFTNQDSLTILDGEETHSLLRVNASQILSISHFQFTNATTFADGAAISMQGVGLILDHCQFTKCQAGTLGGAIYSAGKIVMDSCVFNSCNATEGGALYVSTLQSITIRHSTFLNNSATLSGGAIATAEHYGCHLEANYLTNNLAPKGGALYLANRNDTQQTLLTNNFLTYNSSGAIIHTTGKVGLACNTIIHHSDTAVCVEAASELCAANNIIAANAFDLAYIGSSTLRVDRYNIFSTANHINFTPYKADYLAESSDSAMSYINAMYDSLTVKKPYFGAVAVNALSNKALKEATLTMDLSGDYQFSGLLQEILRTDLKGNARPMDGTATIGAVEYIASPSALAAPMSALNPTTQKIVIEGKMYIIRDHTKYSVLGEKL